jgi:hypothetical protein
MKQLSKIAGGFSRRNLVAGAGTVGLLAASASLLRSPAGSPANDGPPASPATQAKGYRLTEHVKRYYHSTLI